MRRLVMPKVAAEATVNGSFGKSTIMWSSLPEAGPDVPALPRTCGGAGGFDDCGRKVGTGTHVDRAEGAARPSRGATRPSRGRNSPVPGAQLACFGGAAQRGQ